MFREKAMESAHKLFSIAEAALQKYPSIRKVVIMKRTPRYDANRLDPLNLKPQLSSLADSVSFGVWCDSIFKDKIILGGQEIPNGDDQHKQVFGNPDDKSYDGLHMKGPGGKSFLTNSIERVLNKAGLIEIPHGWKNDTRKDSQPPKMSSDGWKSKQRYDAMGIMVDRIRTLSSATQRNRKADHTKCDNDEVFTQADNKPNDRPSVIRSNPKSHSNLQEHYSVPVKNQFSHFLN